MNIGGEQGIQAIIEDLQKQSEIIPDEHDGSYEAMRETIKSYSRMPSLSIVDIPDLNLVYLTSVGTWRHGVDSKKKLIRESSLPETEQDRLIAVWDKLWKKACSNQYDDGIVNGKYSIGMFGTGFMSFEGKSNKECAEAFIQLCVDILPLSIDEEMYQKAEQVLTDSFAGITVEWVIEEYDKDPDVGYYHETIEITPEIMTKGYQIDQTVWVTENGGRYSGNSAEWRVSITIKP